VTVLPAPAHTGVVFVRTDLPDHPRIGATLDNVTLVERRTVIARAGGSVGTVEHFLAAAASLDIDDVLVEIDGPEMPIFDGSARPYLDKLKEARVAGVGGHRLVFALDEPIEYEHHGSEYRATPHEACTASVSIEWDHPAIGRQTGTFTWSAEVFDRELAGARTFGFAKEGPALRRVGLARGATIESVLVLTKRGILDELRWPDEFVRHKALDLFGDLALIGGRLKAAITAHRPSHRGNVGFARRLLHHCTEENDS
jgi:UDP-3-O-acyl N-acetylglucosamine deacetylase